MEIPRFTPRNQGFMIILTTPVFVTLSHLCFVGEDEVASGETKAQKEAVSLPRKVTEIRISLLGLRGSGLRMLIEIPVSSPPLCLPQDS